MKTILILTIARSGSSLLAGILERLNVDMGPAEDLKKGSHLNKYGSYENQEFIALSVNILFEAGILLDFRKRLTIDEKKLISAAEKYREKFRELISKHKSELWGFKEAAAMYYLRHYENEIENPYYIHLIRNYESTASSLLKMIKRNNWKPEYREKRKFFKFGRRLHLYLRIVRLLLTENKYRTVDFMKKVVEDYHNRVLNFLEKKEHITIQLDDIIHKTDEIVDKLCDYIGITPTENQLNSIRKFVHPELLTN